VTCGPLHRDPTNVNFGINDIHPNASITLLDVLSSLPLVLPSEFPDAVRRVATEVSFDQDVKVQVFEMTIRALGSLLSTYQYLDRLPDEPVAQAKALGLTGKTWAAKKAKGVDVKQYRGRLLEMALDLGKRLLPAFNTVTGLPYARVNLRKGVDKGETVETCEDRVLAMKLPMPGLVAHGTVHRHRGSRQSRLGVRGPLPLDG
jgi:mannosidase alpha-like ER degradation enhancer 1